MTNYNIFLTYFSLIFLYLSTQSGTHEYCSKHTAGDVCHIDVCSDATVASSGDKMPGMIKECNTATGMVAEENGNPAQVRLDDVIRLPDDVAR